MREEPPSWVQEALTAWVMRQPWIPITLLCVTAACLAQSLTSAHWLYADTSYVNAVWLGLICGAAVAKARIRSGTAWAYSACLSLLCSSEYAAGILRPVWLAQPNTLWAMHARLEAFVVRVNSWMAALRTGQPVHDTGFFTVVVAVVCWNVSAWLAWCLIRRRRVFEALLPIGFLLAVNIHLSSQDPAWLGFFIGSGLLLMAYAGQAVQQSDWDRRNVDYPSVMGLDWGISAVVVVCVLFALMQAAPVVGTRQGWQALGDVFKGAQQQTAQVASQLFSGVNPPRLITPSPPPVYISRPTLAAPPESSTGPTTAVVLPELTLIGRPPDQRLATVMWVQTSDPSPLPPEVAHQAGEAETLFQHYWRLEIFATYTGSGWQPTNLSNTPAEAAPPLLSPGRYSLWQHFEIVAKHTDRLFAVNTPVTTTTDVSLRRSPLGDTAVVVGTHSAYDVVSLASQASVAQLEAAGADYPADITRLYLQLPDTLPQRVRDLAQRLTANDHTAYDRALHLQEYLRANYAYILNVPAPPAGHDAVDYFLFEAPGGFCSYYASAMTVMLRAIGVPARVVTGYAMGTYDFAHGAYRVPGEAAHAWVEVYFPLYGWVEFEPTAGRSVFTRLAGAPAPTATPTQALPVTWLNVNWGLLFIGLVICGVVAMALRFVRSLEPGWYTPRGRARALYRQVRRALATAGLATVENITPGEFIAAYQGPLSARPAIARALAQVTQLYLQATFSRHTPEPRQLRHVRHLWQGAQWEWLGLWRQAHWSDWAARVRSVFRPLSVVKSPSGGKRHDQS